MNKTITITILLVIQSFTGISIFAQDTIRALFLGNSYTAVNNLPQLVHDLAKSAGDSLYFESNTPGGYTLEGHSTNTTSLTQIAAGGWNFVVLQEQSQLPSFTDAEVESMVFPFAQKLDSIINESNNCTETVFYMTWGRKNGDATNCAVWPPVCTYEGMDSLLYLRYMMMADSNNAIVSPVGAVWHFLRNNNPSIELYSADESHPSEAGSYAAACSFYTVMFRKNPANISYDYTLNSTDAASIRNAVKTVVFDSLTKWHVGEYDPIAAFYANPQPNFEINFSNTSLNSDSWSWDFGDGQFSSIQNPTHTYLTGGNYLTTLIASHCGYSDTTSIWVTASTTAIENSVFSTTIIVYPNPVNELLQIESQNESISSISVFNLVGQEVFLPIQLQNNKAVLNFIDVEAGLYFVKVFYGTNCSVFKINRN